MPTTRLLFGHFKDMSTQSSDAYTSLPRGSFWKVASPMIQSLTRNHFILEYAGFPILRNMTHFCSHTSILSVLLSAGVIPM